MTIKVNLDLVLVKRGMKLSELAEAIDIALPNLVAGRRVVPERAGYYLGHRMAEALVSDRGIAAALRAGTEDFQPAEDLARGIQTA